MRGGILADDVTFLHVPNLMTVEIDGIGKNFTSNCVIVVGFGGSGGESGGNWEWSIFPGYADRVPNVGYSSLGRTAKSKLVLIDFFIL